MCMLKILIPEPRFTGLETHDFRNYLYHTYIYALLLVSFEDSLDQFTKIYLRVAVIPMLAEFSAYGL